MCSESTPLEVVNFPHDLYQRLDDIISNYDVYKVETIGDAYVVVWASHQERGCACKRNCFDGDRAADPCQKFRIRHRANDTLRLRIGIHTGGVVAGVVGKTMPRFCLFGDTVNTASRMESNGEALKIHISEPHKESLDKTDAYIVEERGLIKMKGKGEVRTYWLIGHKNAEGNIRRRDINALTPSARNNASRRGSIVTFNDVILPSSLSHTNLSSLFVKKMSDQNHMSDVSLSGRVSPRLAKRKILKGKVLALPFRARRQSHADAGIEFNTKLHNKIGSAGGQQRPTEPFIVLRENEEDPEQGRKSRTFPPRDSHSVTEESSPERKTSSTKCDMIPAEKSLARSKHEVDGKKWISLNEVSSDGESRVSRSSSGGLLMADNDASVCEENDDFVIESVTREVPGDVSCREVMCSNRSPDRTTLSFTKWISGLMLRKISSESNLSAAIGVNQRLLPSSQIIKEAVIETNV